MFWWKKKRKKTNKKVVSWSPRGRNFLWEIFAKPLMDASFKEWKQKQISFCGERCTSPFLWIFFFWGDIVGCIVCAYFGSSPKPHFLFDFFTQRCDLNDLLSIFVIKKFSELFLTFSIQSHYFRRSAWSKLHKRILMSFLWLKLKTKLFWRYFNQSTVSKIVNLNGKMSGKSHKNFFLFVRLQPPFTQLELTNFLFKMT